MIARWLRLDSLAMAWRQFGDWFSDWFGDGSSGITSDRWRSREVMVG
ncbi:MAG: hypothetical protein MUF72_02010 [Elainella sp. Prado103]|nr:hypothetical protein [Elainella sp. Prado103]